MTARPFDTAGASRRDFLGQSAAVAVTGGALAASLARAAEDPQPTKNVARVHVGGDDLLKVALIGCGGRGSGAAVNAINADKNVKLTVLADAFPDQVDKCRRQLEGRYPEKVSLSDERCFSGFDAYQRALETDVDVVLLATPPHFRPAHLAAAIEAGKHVFCEKPVAVDGRGVRDVLETCEKAKMKGLNVVSGLCWRYDHGVRETMKRVLDGAIGEILSIQENYLTGTLWHRGRDPMWSEMEYQMRNWLYFTWLSGDHIVEQHIHSLDKALWLMGDKAPTRCFGLGGRQARTDAKFGHGYDHFAVCYEWDNGARCHAYTRQTQGCHNDVEDYVVGAKGQAKILDHSISGPAAWRYDNALRRAKPSMYDVEHVELFAAIRAGTPINNGEYMSYSTLMAIMGREACYTGQMVTAEQILKSETSLGPAKYEWGAIEIPTVAIPGVTKLA